uniref:Ig-like domain-containing protein n=1 Tax=Romanomermis culicivorax TaxID=13658 RepID=A0A915I0X7_ROMCU
MKWLIRTTAVIFIIATIKSCIFALKKGNAINYDDTATTKFNQSEEVVAFLRTIVSVHSPFSYQTNQLRIIGFLNDYRKYPSTLLIPDGYLTFLCTKTGCRKTYMLYPSGGLIGDADRRDRQLDRRHRFDLNNITRQRLSVATVRVDNDLELGEYKCVCGKSERTPLYSIQVLYRPCQVIIYNNLQQIYLSFINPPLEKSVCVTHQLKIYKKDSITPTSKCQYADGCTKSLSQLMGCLVVKGGADSRESKSKKSMKCEKLTANICTKIHGPDSRYTKRIYTVCTTNGRKLDNLCEAVASGNSDTTPIYYTRKSDNENCSTKNKDGVFPKAVYWQHTHTPAACSFKYREHWKLTPLQSFVYTEQNRSISLCYVCSSKRSKINYTIEFDKYEIIRENAPCRKMNGSYVAFLNISTSTGPRARINIAEKRSYVDILYASEIKALRSIVSRLSFSPRNIYVTCEHDMNRHESNPANGFIEYEWRDPSGSSIFYPDTKDHGHTHELIGVGNHTCYVKLKSCYFHTKHTLIFASSVYEAQLH